MRQGDMQIGFPFVHFSGTTTELDDLIGDPRLIAGARAWDETLEAFVGFNGTTWEEDSGGVGAVDSVNGQTGVVVLDAGDIANTPAGNISSTDVQTALNELDGEKIPTSYLDTDVTLAANSDAKLATQKATKTYVDNAVTGLLEFKGATDCSANPNYPAALKGDTYVVSVAGKIGGASGKTVGVGDMYLATADNAGGTEASVGTSWVAMETNIRTSDDVIEGAANKYVSAVNMWTSLTGVTATTPVDGDYAVYIRTTSGDLRKVTMSTFRDSYLRANLDTVYAPIAKGVTNGDAHDHVGGDGATLANIPNDGWITATGTWSYSSADSPTFVISINVDVTALIGVGYRIKLTQTTAKYFIVTAVGAYSGGVTLVTVYGGTDYTLANAAISTPFYSPVKMPFGFPLNPDKWTVELSSTSDRLTTNAVSTTWYNAESISIPIGLWSVEHESEAYTDTQASQTLAKCMVTLSTANNSESDRDFTGETYQQSPSGTLGITGVVYRRKILSLAAKTTYYLNYKAGVTGQSHTGVLGSSGTPTKIRAICAYL